MWYPIVFVFIRFNFFQVFYDDCAFPLEFAYYMFAHAFIFFVMFAHFYINAYLTPKTKLKVIKCIEYSRSFILVASHLFDVALQLKFAC